MIVHKECKQCFCTQVPYARAEPRQNEQHPAARAHCGLPPPHTLCTQVFWIGPKSASAVATIEGVLQGTAAGGGVGGDARGGAQGGGDAGGAAQPHAVGGGM